VVSVENTFFSVANAIAAIPIAPIFVSVKGIARIRDRRNEITNKLFWRNGAMPRGRRAIESVKRKK
jgi:hypothetical protein